MREKTSGFAQSPTNITVIQHQLTIYFKYMAKKTIKKVKSADNLAIIGSFDDVISLTVSSKGITPPKGKTTLKTTENKKGVK